MRWHYRHTVLTLCTLAFFATFVARVAISPVVPDIVADFEVTNAVIGVSLTGLWMAYFSAQFPSGVLADRYGERPIILLSVGGTALTTFLIVVAPAFWVFGIGIILLGVFAGLHYSVATALLTRTFDDIGTAIGLHSTGGPVAGLVAPVVVAWLAVRYGWRPAVSVAIAVAAAVFVLFLLNVRPTEPRRPNQPMRERIELGEIRDLLARPPIAFTLVLAVSSEFVWQATASFLPAFLIGHHGLSTTVAGSLFAFYFVVHGIVQIGVGRVSDRVGRDPTTAGCMIAGIVGFSMVVLGSSTALIVGGVFFVGIGMSWIAAVLPRFVDYLSDAEVGVGFGLVRTIYGMMGSVGSVSVGVFADVFDWGVAFGILVVPLALVLGALTVNYYYSCGY